MSHFHHNRRIPGYSACLIVLCGFFYAVNADLSGHLKTMTGTERVKIVFVRCAEPHEVDFPTSTYASDEVLVGFDTEKGSEDTLQTARGSYQNPLITHDGSKVIYSMLRDSTNPATGAKIAIGETYIVDWSKNATPKKIADGTTACLWYDQIKKKEYAIYAFKGYLSGEAFHKIALDDTTDDTLLYTGFGYIYWTRVSSDLRAIGGCMGAFSTAGAPNCVYDLATKEMIVEFGGNCWPTMPYDTTCRLVKITHTNFLAKDIDEEEVESESPGIFSQARMASYRNDIFMIVTDAPGDGGENGTGHIVAVKTNGNFSKIIDTACVTLGIRADHHADLWAGPKQGTGTGFSPGPARYTSPDPSSMTAVFTLDGRRIATLPYGNVAAFMAPLPKKTYLLVYRVAGNPVTVFAPVRGR